MDSDSMKDIGYVEQLKGQSSFMNYWVADVEYNGKIWHKAGDYANREPSKNSAVVEAYHNGSCIQVKNPGSFVNIFHRK